MVKDVTMTIHCRRFHISNILRPQRKRWTMAIPEERKGPTIPDHSAVTDCFGCLRVNVVEYANRTLPAYLRPRVESLPKPVVMVPCGTSRRDLQFSASSCNALDDKNAT